MLSSLAKKMISKFPQLESFLISLLSWMCVFLSMFWETVVQTLQNGTGHLRGLFFECCGGERSTSGWPIFRVSLVLLFHEEGGSHKRLMRGREGGGGDRAGSDEPQPKRKTHSFSSAGWEGGNSQLCRHNMTMNVCVGCEVPSCCDWQAGEEEKEMALFPPTI